MTETTLTKIEAQCLITEIKTGISDIGQKLLELYECRGWEVLGYSSWRECITNELDFQQSHVYRLLDFARVERNLSPIGENLSLSMPTNEYQIRPLAQLEPDQQREAWQEAVETAPNGKVTGAHVEQVVKGRHQVHFSSQTPEWCSPQHIIDRVLAVMGQIDLDPCSPATPNVPAVQHFTKEDDGLSQEWIGCVYMNPPYGREINDWIEYLCKEWDAGRVTEAIALMPARTDTVWFRWLRRFPRCFIWGRLHFSDSDNSAPFPSMIVYLGQNLDAFIRAFGDIGDIYQRVDNECQ